MNQTKNFFITNCTADTSKKGKDRFSKFSIARHQLQDALLGINKRHAYEEALNRCPELVQVEPFLLVEDLHPDKAAVRLVAYWNIRKELFDEQAFQNIVPHVLHEDEFLAMLRSQAMILLPKDSYQRPVLWIDSNKWSDARALRKSLFYWIEIVAASHNQNDAVPSLVMLLTGVSPIVLQCIRQLLPSLPVTVHSLHYWGTHDSLALPSVQAEFPKTIFIHHKVGQTQSLQVSDIAKDGLPVSLGGYWSWEEHLESTLQSYKIAPPTRFFHSESNDQVTDENCDNASWFSIQSKRSLQKYLVERALSTLGWQNNNRDYDRKDAVEEDVYLENDSSVNIVETEALKKKALAEFHHAMSMIPEEEKKVYLEACEECPELFSIECDPLFALRYERFDAWAAARRMTRYWKWRKMLFGERAFLPMTLRGDGALSPEDIRLMQTCFLTVLPNDDEGCILVFSYPNCLKPEDYNNTAARARCHFYLASTVSGDPRAQTCGLRILTVADQGFYESMRPIMKKATRSLRDAGFVRLKCFHMVSCNSDDFYGTLLPKVLKTLTPFFGERFQIHVAPSLEKAAQQLEAYNMCRSGLPDLVGGYSSHTLAFQKWQRERIRYEQRVYNRLLSTPRDRTRRQRYARMLKSRRARQRRKDNEKFLEDEYSRLRQDNLALRAESERLEKLVNQAQTELLSISHSAMVSLPTRPFVGISAFSV